MKGKIIKLKNGGVLVYQRSRLNNSSAVEVGFSVGAECDKKKGTAHFLEHTLFKKTKNRTNAEVERDRNKIVFLNASTSADCLYVRFFRTNKLIKKSLEFAYDVLMNSVLDDEFVESEKGVIKEELKMCLDEENQDIYLKNFKQSVGGSIVASDVVGSKEENVESIQFEDLKEFKDKYFVGNNFICSVVSSLPCLKIKRLINSIFVARIPKKDNYQKPSSYFERIKVDGKTSLNIVNQAKEKVSVLMSFKMNVSEEDIYAKNYNYTFLARYLSGSQGNLFLKLRNEGLIYRIAVDFSNFKDTSLFNIEFETSKEKIKQTIDVIKDEIKNVCENFVSEDLICEYRQNLEYYADEKMPTKMTSKCHANIVDYLRLGKLFRLTKRQKKMLRKGVCPEGVKTVAGAIFNKNTEMYVTILGNVSKNDVPTLEYFKENFLIVE